MEQHCPVTFAPCLASIPRTLYFTLLRKGGSWWTRLPTIFTSFADVEAGDTLIGKKSQLRPADLPDVEIEEGRARHRPISDDDVFILVKEYICSPALGQKPLLCLPAEAAQSYPLVPQGCFA